MKLTPGQRALPFRNSQARKRCDKVVWDFGDTGTRREIRRLQQPTVGDAVDFLDSRAGTAAEMDRLRFEQAKNTDQAGKWGYGAIAAASFIGPVALPVGLTIAAIAGGKAIYNGVKAFNAHREVTARRNAGQLSAMIKDTIAANSQSLSVVA